MTHSSPKIFFSFFFAIFQEKMKFFRRFSSLKELGFKPMDPSSFPPIEKTMLKDAYAARLHAHGTFFSI